ncbi:translocation and assembly module lipoprotein TamL [Maribellus maritimus]|uniref:translocation and assembly module lipoprotein TamL n=1 Tax=Maribellus maritimus TaxID=2870838 RepID=UPI001EEB412F|nr:BamA/TamA family outer membrane protein [Maribellus maritimus]MCG6185834.1 BamA/TamA family outer membrane protein [Maribellus maritimus]
MNRRENLKKLGYRLAIAVIAGIFLLACSPVKFVPENSYLLNKVEVEVDNAEINKDEAKAYVRQKENYKILGFAKFHLWLYNLSSKEKSDGWLKRIGEPPQIYNEALAIQSEGQLKQYLNNRGYFHASVDQNVEYNDKKQKANVTYSLETGEIYRIRDINYHFSNIELRRLFMSDSSRTHIKPGTAFDYYMLDKQRSSIVDLFRNNGYYYFAKEDVSYLADSSRFEKEIVLDLYVGDNRNSSDDSAKVFTPYFFNNFYVSVLPGTAPLNDVQQLNSFTDTLWTDNFTVYRNNQIKYKPLLFERSLQMKKGDRYSISDVESTFNSFNRLRQFRFIDIQFQEPQMEKDTNLLDCFIRLAPLSKQSTSFDIEGTNTSGNMGIAGNINYQHRNLFHGAEVLNIKLRGAMERLANRESEYFNTREVGVESNITIPRLLGPGNIIGSFKSFMPKTVFTLGYNFQRRPEYTRTIANVKFGYEWMRSETFRQTLNLLDFNMVNLYQFDPEFIANIEDLYIKSSFTDHLILASNYSFTYNTQGLNSSKGYSYLKLNVESAGNLLSLASSLTNQPKVQVVDTFGVGTSEYYRIFSTRFAQYVKSDVEFRYGYTIDKYNTLVARAFLGAGVPYGNFDVLPFEKKYFTGGANGIRAWQVRSLGPGTYKASKDTYPNQSSDIKLEANLEYRFKLISFIEGALFLDAGNIWAINKKDNREGALFEFDKFYKQLAFGTGTGLRFDFNYFIFRLDLGMKLRQPSDRFTDGWIIGNRSYKADDFNLSFAIGYPF